MATIIGTNNNDNIIPRTDREISLDIIKKVGLIVLLHKKYYN
jgi:hypothetical protein